MGFQAAVVRGLEGAELAAERLVVSVVGLHVAVQAGGETEKGDKKETEKGQLFQLSLQRQSKALYCCSRASKDPFSHSLLKFNRSAYTIKLNLVQRKGAELTSILFIQRASHLDKLIGQD